MQGKFALLLEPPFLILRRTAGKTEIRGLQLYIHIWDKIVLMREQVSILRELLKEAAPFAQLSHP
jgi:hypothetical protein